MEVFMELLTEEILKTLPKLYSTEKIPEEKKMFQIKYFCPWNHWTWYAVEGSKEGDDFIFFGYVIGFEKEWGNFSLNELKSVNGPFGLGIERDLYFGPTPVKEVLEKCG
jgi:hypothetical protein